MLHSLDMSMPRDDNRALSRCPYPPAVIRFPPVKVTIMNLRVLIARIVCLLGMAGMHAASAADAAPPTTVAPKAVAAATAIKVSPETATVRKHNTIVYKEPARYGGWPANHGIWAWEDEVVVGFTAAYFKSTKTDHAVDRTRPFAKMQARSFDGGETWTVEKPLNVNPEAGAQKTTRLAKPLDFTAPGFALMFDFGHMHVGPSYFYASNDRCQSWQGPYTLKIEGIDQVVARTDYLVLSQRECIMFGSAAKADNREGRPFCARTLDGGLTWKLLSKIGDEPAGYAIMPSTVRLPNGDFYTTIRHWEPKSPASIDAYRSSDDGRSWRFLGAAAPNIGGGNPPALVKLRDGRLALSYGYRAKPWGVRARISDDEGMTWGPEIILRDDAPGGDLGYPRSIQRPDGQILTVYYYNGPRDDDRAIETTVWQPPAGKSPAGAKLAAASMKTASKNAPVVFDRVRFLPARDRAAQMVGGKFQGSNESSLAGFVTLAEIKAKPAENTWTEIAFDNQRPYRWIRYVAPAGSRGNVAEIAFFAGKTKLNGGGFGSAGSLPPGGHWKTVVDNRPETWFNSSVADDQYVGLDLGDRASTARVAMIPGPGNLQKSESIALKCGTPGATIRYTLDGTTPGPNEGQLYTSPIMIDKLATLTAIAFSPDLAPSQASYGTYLVGEPVSTSNSFHIGNSLTGNASKIPLYARTAGRVQNYQQFLIGGSLTVQLWNAKETFDKARWDEGWSKAALPLDIFTVQPRDFNVDQEAEYELKFFDQIRATSPNVQPWMYAEWVEMNRARPSDKGEVPSYQMQRTVPALTWQESMSAMLLYVEEVQHRVMKSYQGAKPPRIIPVSLAMGQARTLIDRGELPGVAPGETSFYSTLFDDQVHVSNNGSYLVDLVWYAAFYGESPEGKVLPIGTTLSAPQAQRLQQLAWDVVKNYPDCGLYETGSTPVEEPQLSVAPGPLKTPVQLSIASSTPGAWFRYTLDGTTPTRKRGYVSCGVVSVRPGDTLKVVGYKSGMADSTVRVANYPKAN
jgi:hypothetical protein